MNEPIGQRAALQDIRVIEFSGGVAAGYCGALFAACGAEVIQIEAPETGAETRRLPPFFADTSAPEASGMHVFLSAGKRSVTLDLDSPEGRDSAHRLATRSHVIIDGIGPGEMAKLGLEHDVLGQINPQLTTIALSWFGHTGRRRHWKATDAIIQSLSGFLYPIGPKDGPPIIPGGYNAQITAGLTGFIAGLTSLIGTTFGDRGASIDQSVLEAQTTFTETAGVRMGYDGSRSMRQGINKFTPSYPQTIYPSSDGWIGVTALTPAQWRSCCELVGAPDLIDDPRFLTAKARSDNADELDVLLQPLFEKRSSLEWFHEAQARRVPFAPVPTPRDMRDYDHVRSRQVFASFSHPDTPTIDVPTIPWKFEATAMRRGGTAPRLGQHTHEVTARTAAEDPRHEASEESVSAQSLPLRNIRIVDLTMGWSGPLATRHMADMGAEIVKIEACKYPDWWRGWEYSHESIARQEHERSPAFNQINRNKLGVAIDLTHPDGRALALELVARADAVIENQATGVMEKLGLSFHELRRVNPQLVMLSLPGFGTEGPWAGYRAYGSTVEHAAGLPHFTGAPDGPPVQTHVAYGDACGGLNAAAALLVALFHCRRTGVGQRVELSQTECMMQLGIHGMIADAIHPGADLRAGNRHPAFAPHGCFACREDDSWLTLAVTSDEQWQALCRVIDREDLARDEALARMDGRRDDERRIESIIAEWARDQLSEAAAEALQMAGVPAASVRRPTDILHDEDYKERSYWLEIERDVVGIKPHPAAPWRFNGARPAIRTPAPLLGEHNRYVFGELLRLSTERIDELERDGIIGEVPTAAV
jgi:crotonobetainyl-CoA:carnitine CoA-transferase CaiB-like acyl-CoA transferase